MSITTNRAAAATGLLLWCCAAVAAGALDRSVYVDIPAQPVTPAMLELSRQAGIQVILAGSNPGEPQPSTRRLLGRMSLRQALQLMLQDTPYRYRALDSNIITLEMAGPSGDSR